MRSLVALLGLLAVGCNAEPSGLEEDAAERVRLREATHALYVVGDTCMASGPGTRWEDRAVYAPSREDFARLAREESDPAILDFVFTASVYCEDPEIAWVVLGRLGGAAALPQASQCVEIRMSNGLACARKQRLEDLCCSVDGTCVNRPGCLEWCAATCPPPPQ